MATVRIIERRPVETSRTDSAVPAPPPVVPPAGEGPHVVQAGETLASIAEQSGHFWETIWNDPANAALKSARGDAQILLPGDRITIPPLRQKTVACSTGAVHRFRRRGIPAWVEVQVRSEDGVPQTGCDFVLRVGKTEYKGKTDGDGKIRQWVMPSERTGTLTVRGADGEIVHCVLELGFLDPLGSLSGIQGRLTALGYGTGEQRGEPDSAWRDTLRAFQADRELPVTGEVDEATLAELRKAYGV